MNSDYFQKRIPIIKDLGFRETGLIELKKYIDLLWASNEELNLISRKMTYEELIDNHVIDCLLPLQKFPTDVKSVADFGSGGGLPAVIYAIQFPQIQFRLYEKSKLKQDFLNRCKSIAPNLDIQGEIPIRLLNVDLVTARGFKPVDVILDVSRSYYQTNGKYFLLKARLEKIEEELTLARKKFKDLKVRVEPLKSPVLEVERHLVLIHI
ncbi:MAG: ribosomal RNA small subunit methyltransferase G [Oligoflexia bacterium]|nr:MAG: ribosomal RNA small subunit methyltransferase G [Oligoflexia bacterium]